jgi:hypothetical protein
MTSPDGVSAARARDCTDDGAVRSQRVTARTTPPAQTNPKNGIGLLFRRKMARVDREFADARRYLSALYAEDNQALVR